jgi:simple sugar transport system ATP-binding protein
MMVGKDVVLGGKKRPTAYNEVILELQDVSCREGKNILLDGISISLRRGEILGISGIDGSGQTELAESICGIRKIEGGVIRYNGQDITQKTVYQRKKEGIAFIPQDRHRDGLALSLSVENNLLLGQQRKLEYRGRGHTLNRKAVKSKVLDQIKRFDIRTSAETQIVSTLSGGNQQKIIVAREVDGNPSLIVADQPTRGIDVAAIEFIHNVLTEKRNNGCGIILVSLELDELLFLSDRIAVMNHGKIAGIVDPAVTTREEIGLLMLGNYKGGGPGDPAQEI